MKKRMPLAEALLIAEAVKERLSPLCFRIEIAGSVRRKAPEVGDIEIVCIPMAKMDLFGERGGTLLDNLAGQTGWKSLRAGDRYKQLLLPCDLCLDVFIVTPATFGVQLLIRTGPAAFSHAFVTPARLGGKYLPVGWKIEGGRLWDGEGKPVDTPEEEAVFDAIYEPFVRPEDR